MKVFDLGDKAIFQYRVNIPSENKTPCDDVINWMKQNKIQGAVVPGVAFFHREQDVTMFMLRWS